MKAGPDTRARRVAGRFALGLIDVSKRCVLYDTAQTMSHRALSLVRVSGHSMRSVAACALQPNSNLHCGEVVARTHAR